MSLKEAVYIETVERLTVNQAECDLWHKMRESRISASKVNQHFQNFRRGGKDLLKKKLKNKDKFIFSKFGQVALAWGRAFENCAIQKYQEITGLKVEKCGLHILKEDERVCASPDGKVVGSHGEVECLIEVKCPYTKKDKTIEECVKERSFYLKSRTPLNEEREKFINESLHPVWQGPLQRKYYLNRMCTQGARIYDQIQLQLLCADVKECHLVVYTKRGLAILPISRDPTFKSRVMQLIKQLPPLPKQSSVNQVRRRGLWVA